MKRGFAARARNRSADEGLGKKLRGEFVIPVASEPRTERSGVSGVEYPLTPLRSGGGSDGVEVSDQHSSQATSQASKPRTCGPGLGSGPQLGVRATRLLQGVGRGRAYRSKMRSS